MNLLYYLCISTFNVIMRDGSVDDNIIYRPNDNFFSGVIIFLIFFIFLLIVIGLIFYIKQPNRKKRV